MRATIAHAFAHAAPLQRRCKATEGRAARLTQGWPAPTLARTLVLACAIVLHAVKRESGSYHVGHRHDSRPELHPQRYNERIGRKPMHAASSNATAQAGQTGHMVLMAPRGKAKRRSSVRIPARYVGRALRGCGAPSMISMRALALACDASSLHRLVVVHACFAAGALRVATGARETRRRARHVRRGAVHLRPERRRSTHANAQDPGHHRHGLSR